MSWLIQIIDTLGRAEAEHNEYMMETKSRAGGIFGPPITQLFMLVVVVLALVIGTVMAIFQGQNPDKSGHAANTDEAIRHE